mgnify:CR=1 FL=1
MCQIYLYEGNFQRGDGGWSLVREAARRYGWEQGLPHDFMETEIHRSDKGKPFFVDVPVEFSLSHSGMMWMCMLSQGPCGLDLQVVERARDWQAICDRQCSTEEKHYVELWGIEGFYQIWVRKEAFGKCTGNGIFSKMPSMVDKTGDLCHRVTYEGVTYYMEEITILPEVKCAYCTTKEEQIELRILG